MYKLETSRGPLPRRRNPRTSKYPFDTMAVREFFFVPDGRPGTMYVTASRAGSRLGRTFRTRYTTMLETLEGWEACDPTAEGATWGVGCWRDR